MLQLLFALLFVAGLAESQRPVRRAIANKGVLGRQGCTVISNLVCYPDLIIATREAADGATVEFTGTQTIAQEIIINKSIKFSGVQGAKVVASVLSTTEPTGATIFRVTTPDISISFSNIEFVNVGEYGSVLRTKELGTDTYIGDGDIGPVSLVVSDCKFSGFRTGLRGGSVFFIGTAKKVDITRSVFTNNTVEFDTPIMYEGGGAIWIVWASEVSIKESHFELNSNLFGHGIGGCLGINNASSTIVLNGNDFINNTANGGGVLFIGYLLETAKLSINSHFRGNIAKDNGWESGCRGGVGWLERIYGDVDSNGLYEENYGLGCRGAVFANNWLTGVVSLLGTYRDNHSGKGGSVWDTHYRGTGVVVGNLSDIGNSEPSIKLILYRPYTNEDEATTAEENPTVLDSSDALTMTSVMAIDYDPSAFVSSEAPMLSTTAVSDFTTVVSTPAIVQPTVSTPAIVQLTVSTPAFVQPSVSTPAIVQLTVSTPAFVQPSVSTPAIVQLTVSTPAIVQLTVSTPAFVQPSVSTPAMATAVTLLTATVPVTDGVSGGLLVKKKDASLAGVLTAQIDLSKTSSRMKSTATKPSKTDDSFFGSSTTLGTSTSTVTRKDSEPTETYKEKSKKSTTKKIPTTSTSSMSPMSSMTTKKQIKESDTRSDDVMDTSAEETSEATSTSTHTRSKSKSTRSSTRSSTTTTTAIQDADGNQETEAE